MVRRRSTVRFRKGAQVHDLFSNDRNESGPACAGDFRGTVGVALGRASYVPDQEKVGCRLRTPARWLKVVSGCAGRGVPRSWRGRLTLSLMTLTLDLPSGLAAALEAEAARRGQSPDRVAADLLAERLPERTAGDALEAFIGSADSGDVGWAGRDTHELRAEAAARAAGQPD